MSDVSVLKIDRGTGITFLISDRKCISALVKFCQKVSDKITFFITYDKIIIRCTGCDIVEATLYTENFLYFELSLSDVMSSRLKDGSIPYIDITFEISKLLKVIGKSSKTQTISFIKKPGDSKFMITKENSNASNNIGYSMSGSESELFVPETDGDHYNHILTFKLSSLISSLQDLSKCYPPDSLVEIIYRTSYLSINVLSEESGSSISFGTQSNSEIIDTKLFHLSQLSEIVKINGIVTYGVIKCYISEKFIGMLFTIAVSDIGVCNIYICPPSEISLMNSFGKSATTNTFGGEYNMPSFMPTNIGFMPNIPDNAQGYNNHNYKDINPVYPTNYPDSNDYYDNSIYHQNYAGNYGDTNHIHTYSANPSDYNNFQNYSVSYGDTDGMS